MSFKKISPEESKILTKKLKQFIADSDWVLDNHKELVKHYNRKYVAVLNKEVRYSSPSMYKIVDMIKKSNESVEDFDIEYITDEKIEYIFEAGSVV